MSRSSLLVFFVVSVFVSEAFSEEWDSCYNACERHYQDDLQAPCKAGCRKAAELRQVSSGAEQPQSCAAMCARNYSEITQAGACEFGCDAPSDNIKTLLSNLLSFSRFGNADKTSEDHALKTSSEEPPKKLRVLVIKRFHFRVPEEGGSDSHDLFNSLLPGNGPIPLPSNEETPDEFDQHPSIIPKHESLLVHVPSSPSASGHKSESSPEPVSQAFRYIGSHPLIILFSVTLLALCVLLIVQVTLECKRRRRRASHFQYNQFDELPTYVEATTIKVPADSDSNGGVAADSNKV